MRANRRYISHGVIEHRFHLTDNITKDEAEAMEMVAAFFRETAHNIGDVLPEGRYKSMTMTALEEAMVWAQRSVVNDLRPAKDKSGTL